MAPYIHPISFVIDGGGNAAEQFGFFQNNGLDIRLCEELVGCGQAGRSRTDDNGYFATAAIRALWNLHRGSEEPSLCQLGKELAACHAKQGKYLNFGGFMRLPAPKPKLELHCQHDIFP